MLSEASIIAALWSKYWYKYWLFALRRLQCSLACLIQNGHQGIPKWPLGFEERSRLRKLIGPFDQLSLNKFFDSFTISMTTSKIQNGHEGAQKWSNPWFLGAPVIFFNTSFIGKIIFEYVFWNIHKKAATPAFSIIFMVFKRTLYISH